MTDHDAGDGDTVRMDGWRLTCPSGWARGEDEATGVPVLIEPPRDDGLFRANLSVVAVEQMDAAETSDYAIECAAALAEAEMDGFWLLDLEPGDDGAAWLCRVLFTHVHDGVRLTAEQRHLSAGGHGLVVTATVETIEFAIRHRDLAEILDSVEVADV